MTRDHDVPHTLKDGVLTIKGLPNECPDEACGVVAGPVGSDTPTRHIPMENAARSMTFYEFDSMEHLRVWREMDDRDEEPVVIYHSHTATEAYPSRTDISFAGEPGAHYLLVSTREPDTEEIRSFRIVDGVVTEEPVRILEHRRVVVGGAEHRQHRLPRLDLDTLLARKVYTCNTSQNLPPNIYDFY